MDNLTPVDSTNLITQLHYLPIIENVIGAGRIHITAYDNDPKIVTNSIIDSSFDKIHIENTLINRLTFKNCIINTLTIFCIPNCANEFIFDDCQILELDIVADAEIDNSVSVIKRLQIKGENSRIDDVKLYGRINRLNLMGGVIKTFSCDGARYQGKTTFIISRCAFEMFTVSSYGNVQIKITHGISPYFNFYYLDDCAVDVAGITNTRIVLQSCKLENLSLSESQGIYLKIINAKIETSYFNECFFDMIEIRSRCTIEGLATIRSYCNELLLENLVLSEVSKMHFSMEFKKIVVLETENNGSIEFNSPGIFSSLHFIKSQLGNLTINDFEVTNEKNIYIFTSNIENIKFLNVRWKNKHKLNENWESPVDDEIKNFSLRESYRQLKNNYTSNGNKIEALEFQKHELRLHYSITQSQMLESIINGNNRVYNLGNLLILWTHKSVSDFGQNVWRPLVLLIAFHAILFSILIYTTPELQAWYKFDLVSSVHTVGYFFNTVLPTHGSTLINYATHETVDISGIADFLMRLFSAYFIFYFITATRKYHQ